MDSNKGGITMYRGYKTKWEMYIEGEAYRMNKNGYYQILDKNTHRWVTVDSIDAEEEND